MRTEMGQVQEQKDLTITMEDVQSVSRRVPNWKAEEQDRN